MKVMLDLVSFSSSRAGYPHAFYMTALTLSHKADDSAILSIAFLIKPTALPYVWKFASESHHGVLHHYLLPSMLTYLTDVLFPVLVKRTFDDHIT